MVVGSGIAGLTAALTAMERARVLVISKGSLDAGCTRWAQGGIAAAVGPEDSPELHFQDTVAAGRGLCDEAAVRVLVEEAPARIQDLVAWGVVFDREGDQPSLHQEAAHRLPRVLHARGDATGLEIETALTRRLWAGGARILEGHVVTRLCLDAAGRCDGVEVCDLATGERTSIGAGSVILACGGAAGLWRHSTNPAGATGDGIALAYEAGAEIADVEFMQFHPTVLSIPGSSAFLISEAVRGAGAHVLDGRGRRFLLDADPRGELAPRDVVARTIWQEMARTGGVSVALDCRPMGPALAGRFPTVAAICRQHGIDPATTPIPIAPAAHYTIGGVVTDLGGATSVPGLYACGEVARSGVHGANRLASNSLLEGAVFGARAAGSALGGLAETPPPPPAWVTGGPRPGADSVAAVNAMETSLRTLMWEACGISRNGRTLESAVRVIDAMKAEVEGAGSMAERSLELALTTAGLVARAAFAREESRGAHHRGDHPDSNDSWHGSYVMHTERGAHLDRDPATHC